METFKGPEYRGALRGWEGDVRGANPPARHEGRRNGFFGGTAKGERGVREVEPVEEKGGEGGPLYRYLSFVFLWCAFFLFSTFLLRGACRAGD